MRQKLLLGVTILSCVFLSLCGSARAQGSSDYTVLIQEYAKPAAQRDWNVVDQKIAAILANRGDLDGSKFTDVKKRQLEREIQKLGSKMTADDAKRITQEALALIGEIRTECLHAGVTDSFIRNQAYIRQLMVLRLIRNPDLTQQTQTEIIDGLCRDIEEQYIKSTSLSNSERVDRLLGAAGALWPLQQAKDIAAADRVYEMVLKLGTPESRRAYLHRAEAKIRRRLLAEAVKDYDAALADAKSPVDLKRTAHLRRMQMLMNLQRWEEAKADGDALSQLSMADAEGSFGPELVAEGKLDAARVRMALGELTWEAYETQGETILVDVLKTDTLSVEKKSAVTTAVLLMLSKEATTACRWEQALGLARTAYGIAPNSRVPETVTLIQQLLANRSRGTLKGDSFSLAPNTEDVASAEAFFARQSGQKKRGDQTIVLKPDLSNDGEFPRQLDHVVVPFQEATKSALEEIAVGHPDYPTRALAQGVLLKSDAAIESMVQAVRALGLDSGQLSAYANLTARFVRGKLESVALANAFLNSQVHGPAGADGKLGTDEDIANPLAAASKD